jgi:hypothetical protein
MKSRKNLSVLKGALAVAAILAISGSALAKKPASLGGTSATLSSDRKTVTVNATPKCMASPGATLSAEYSIYIFQAHGRLINIGIGTEAGDCVTSIPVDVEAIDGLTFQPGPATMIIKVTTVATTNVPVIDPVTGLPMIDPVTGLPVTTPTDTVIGTAESGAKINLH